MAKKARAEFRAKDRVNHSVFGPGTIGSTDAQFTVIVFDQGGTRKFVTSMVKLEPTDRAEPVQAGRGTAPAAGRDGWPSDSLSSDPPTRWPLSLRFGGGDEKPHVRFGWNDDMRRTIAS